MKKIILRTAISLFFIGLLFWSVREDIPRIFQALQNINLWALFLAALIFLFTILVMAKRLQIIFGAEGIAVKFMDSSNITFIGCFFNNFLPTSVGGDIVKAMCASRITGEPVKSVTSVLMDRIFGLFTFIVIPSITLFFVLKESQDPLVPLLVYSFLAFSIFFFFLLFDRKLARRFHFIETLLNYLNLGSKIRKIYDGLHKFKDNKTLIVKVLSLSIIGQSVNILVLYILALALGVHSNIIYFFLLVPVVHLISMVPSLGGLGVREWAYIKILAPYVGREYAAAIGILWLAFLFLSSLIGGVIYLIRHDYHIRFKGAAVPSESGG